MGKDTFYFTHDYNARMDEKIRLLIRKHGMRGYGIYWAIIEDLYNNANALRLDCDGIAFELREQTDIIKSVIFDFDLFSIESDFFGSKSVEKRLNERNEKSTNARKSAFKRWSKCDGNAMAMQTQCEGNAIKKEKKERKESIKPRKISFSDSEIFDKVKFKETFPTWSQDKLRHYYEAANRYSIEGNKYVSWELAIETWEKKDVMNGVVIDKPKEKPIIW